MHRPDGARVSAVKPRGPVRPGMRGCAALLALVAYLFLFAANTAYGVTREAPSVAKGDRYERGMLLWNDSELDEGDVFYSWVFVLLHTGLGEAWHIDPSSPNPVQSPPALEPRDEPADGSPIPVPVAFPKACSPQRFAAVHPSQRLIYIATSGGPQGFICAFRFDPVALTLTPAPGSPFATGGEPVRSFAIDPSGTFLYAVGNDNSAAVAFTIDPTTGALTKLAGSPYPTAANPMSLAVDPSGRFVYVATSANKTFASTISAYAIDAATGALTPLPGSPYKVPDSAYALAMDPLGRYVYLSASGTLQAYAINAATGALAPIGTPVVGEGRIAVDPAGRFVYVEASEYIAPRTVEGVRA
ncbi:MAG: beta-propeller fold lactonase family protein, partial [Burkholderiales bacterium]|nr:beta-propeller fold lactonase family protein [Burkholderiales bacterium]